ncbi:MAG: hypothetical protein U1F46_02765 [Marinagarivorans sp.]
MRFYITLFLVSILCACGSGGGSSSGSSSTTQPLSNFSLRFNPGQINETRVLGDLFHPIQIQALFQGKTPSSAVVVFATLDNNINSFSFGLNETSADIFFFINPALTVGKYEGQISIDICSDPQCKNRFGPTNKLTYRLNIQNGSPQYTVSNNIGGQQQKSSNQLYFNYIVGEDRPEYRLNIEFPGAANSIVFPKSFMDRYQVETISNSEYRIKLPYYNTLHNSETFDVQFLGENYSNYFPLYIYSNLEIPNLPAVSMLSAARNMVGNQYSTEDHLNIYNINPKYCSDSSLSIELDANQQSDWTPTVSRENSSCTITFNYKLPGVKYGFYDAVVLLKSQQELVGKVPVTIAYSEQSLSESTNPVSIFSSTSAEELAREQNFWMREDGPFTAIALSPWIKNLSNIEGSSNTFRYTLSIDELKKINTISEKRVTGYVKVQGGTPNTNYKIVPIDFTFNIPTVFDISPKAAAAGAPFDLTIFGNNFFLTINAVEIIKFKDINRTVVDSRFTYTLSSYKPNDEAGSATFSMPALSVGFYQLNFASIWIDQYPKLLLTIE